MIYQLPKYSTHHHLDELALLLVFGRDRRHRDFVRRYYNLGSWSSSRRSLRAHDILLIIKKACDAETRVRNGDEVLLLIVSKEGSAIYAYSRVYPEHVFLCSRAA